MKLRTNMVFCCSRYRGDTRKNIEKAKKYARMIAVCGYSPVVPHLLFPQFLDDSNPEERIKGITLGIDQLMQCDEMWIFGTKISDGMAFEIDKAREYGIVVRLHDDEGNIINPATLKIDDRVDSEYRRAVHGLKFRSL